MLKSIQARLWASVYTVAFVTNVPATVRPSGERGEAYAAAGLKDLAIQNYEKSVQLNPKNENGKAALAKLKGR